MPYFLELNTVLLVMSVGDSAAGDAVASFPFLVGTMTQ